MHHPLLDYKQPLVSIHKAKISEGNQANSKDRLGYKRHLVMPNNMMYHLLLACNLLLASLPKDKTMEDNSLHSTEHPNFSQPLVIATNTIHNPETLLSLFMSQLSGNKSQLVLVMTLHQNHINLLVNNSTLQASNP